MGEHANKNDRNCLPLLDMQRSNLKLVTHPETFEQNMSGSAVGVVFFESGDSKFPADSWYDFPLSIFTWWLAALDQENEVAQLVFKDGPYLVELSSSGLNWVFQGIRRGENKLPVFEAVIEKSVLKAQIKAAAFAWIDTLTVQSKHPEGIEELRIALRK
ncbi:MAG: hypothetical protein AAF438_22065 [Pseudomonadota bacterium]